MGAHQTASAELAVSNHWQPNRLPIYSYSEVTDVHHSRPGPSDQSLATYLARPYRRVPVLAAWPDAVRSGPVMRFVRNNQHHVLFHRLTSPEPVQPLRGACTNPPAPSRPASIAKSEGRHGQG